MKRNTTKRKVGRLLAAAMIVSSGMTFAAIPGCKTEYSNLFFDGLEAGITAVIPGFFELIKEDVEDTDTSLPTV